MDLKKSSTKYSYYYIVLCFVNFEWNTVSVSVKIKIKVIKCNLFKCIVCVLMYYNEQYYSENFKWLI